MRSLRRSLAVVGLGIVTAIALTGCIKFDIALTVSDQDNVSGEATVAMSKALVEMGGTSTDSTTSDLFAQENGVTQVPFDDGTFVGSTYMFDAVPLVNFSASESELGQIAIVREGDDLITTGTFDLGSSSSTEPSDSMASEMMISMSATAQMSIAINYPGEIVSTNGAVDGQTVTWTPKFGEITVIKAVVKAAQFNVIPVLIGIGVVVVAAGGVLAFLLLRRKKTSMSLSAPDAPELPMV